MEIISARNVWNIIKKTLDCVDNRLVSHGERVAYLTYQLLRFQGESSAKKLAETLFISLLHDIGAYKTEEIDHMVEFETETMWEHSIYGYLFLKQLSPIWQLADIVLYHHADYQDYEKIRCSASCREAALLVKLADRIDILSIDGRGIDRDYLKRAKGSLFDPEQVELFFRADEELHLEDKLADGSYTQEMEEIIGCIRLTEEEKRMYLQMMAFSIDFRSEHMVLHTATTNSISMVLARMAGIGSDETEKIYFGSLLHDLGKIAIPVSILEKAGRLTEEEMVVMRRHVEITGNILCGFVQNDIYKIAVRHHEKMDGSGYPAGLKGNELSLSERIVAVADVMSALIHKRSYKEPYPAALTCQLLMGMRDDHKLSADIVELAVGNYDRLVEEALKDSRDVMELYADIKREYDVFDK